MSIIQRMKQPDLGLLLIRLVIGLTYMQFGFKKILSGAPALEQLGSALEVFGITTFPLFWGVLAALAELLGGCLVFIGYQFRIAALVLCLVMVIAFIAYFEGFGPFGSIGMSAWSLQMAALFLGLALIGPGKYSLDKG